MSKKIVDIINITSAHGWYLTEDNGTTFEPVACWALVVQYDARFESLPPERSVIGLKSSELDDVLGVSSEDRIYMHSSEVDSLREKVVVTSGIGEF